MVEQNDFASGVTSRSTRIIHGGLRYLEHGELSLVRESLHDREKLLREKSHLVHPLHLLLLLNENSERNAMKVRAGLWLYQRMAGKPPSAGTTEMELKQLERVLDAGHRWTIFDYEDAQCEFPERLVAEWLMEAVEAGAVVRNHMEALAVNVAHGRIHGVLLRDQITGRDERIAASWVINCSGPWADRVCQRSSIRTTKPMLGGIRGSHIVLPRFSGSPAAAIYTEAVDGRPIFVLPWNDQVLVGTTEVADNGDPGETVPSADEINYLVRSGAQLFPKAKISAQNVKHAFAGIRPLPYSPGNRLCAKNRVTGHRTGHDCNGTGAGSRSYAGRRRAGDCPDRGGKRGIGAGHAGVAREKSCRHRSHGAGERRVAGANLSSFFACDRGGGGGLSQRVRCDIGRRPVTPRAGGIGRVLVGIVQPRGGVAHWRGSRLERPYNGRQPGSF